VPPLVHIVESDPSLAAALAALLHRHGHPSRVFETAARFLTDAGRGEGCILLDLRLPDMSGDRLLEELARRGVVLPVVAMAAPGDPAVAIRAMKLGAVDFLEKPVAEGDLVAAVERALEAWRADEDRRQARAAAEARLQRLSPRERQILQGLLGGLSNKAIARALGLSPRTVEMHRANMMDDLGLTSLSEALRLAIDAGLAPLAEEGGDRPAAPPPAERPRALARRGSGGESERRHEEKLKLVLEASGDGAWEWIIPTSEIRLSPRLVERFGYSLAEAPDSFDALADFIHPEDWEHFREQIVSEITGRKEEERRAREAAELLELALWGAGAGIWEVDLETRIVRLCRRSRELLGLPLEGSELVGWDDWEATIHPDDRAATAAALDHAIATAGPFSAEYRALHPDGTSRRIRGLGKLICDSAGRSCRLVGLHQEIEAGEGPSGLSLRGAGR
jgi:two-component system response regulator FixJ